MIEGLLGMTHVRALLLTLDHLSNCIGLTSRDLATPQSMAEQNVYPAM